MNRRLPAICRWIFAALTVLMLIATAGLLSVWVIDPSLPPNTKINTAVGLSDLPGGLQVKTVDGAVFQVKELQATVSTTGKDLNPLVDLIKRFGLPVAMLYTVYFAVLFDLMRRLFRKVEKGDSFTPQTVRLVQTVGFSLIGFSLVSAVAEGFLSSALADFFRTHAVLTGTGLKWVAAGNHEFALSFDGSYLLTGLLVLALSEVFRQGLALKNDHDLTI